ncbi:MAG: hypothetical protein HIU81_01730 [Acidobacteria bacterium]|nr:hypothetical protein [Acidobacteriota bacterium]
MKSRQDEPEASAQESSNHPWLLAKVTRRSLIASSSLAGVGALAVGAFAGRTLMPVQKVVATSTGTPTGAHTDGNAAADRTFVSTKLTTPHITCWATNAVGAGLVFVTPQGHGSAGAILDSAARPVWMEPSGAGVMDLRVQTFEGQQVLTYWSGTTSKEGHGSGQGVILDARYRTVATVATGNGLSTDLHEFKLTAAGTALLIAYPTVPADLSAVGGPSKGFMLDCHVQEVNVRTKEVLLDWKASDHIDLSETYATPGGALAKDGTTEANAFDAYHLNSVDEQPDVLLVSSRHTHTLYQISRTTGDVQWRMGGKKSDYKIADNAAYAWQHDARRRSATQITVFDNHFAEGTTGTSRGLFLAIDETTKSVTLEKELADAGHGGNAEGNVQFLPNGNYMVGWGADPSATEFAPDGTAVFEANNIGNGCYRVYRFPWVGTPDSLPDLAAQKGDSASMKVFVSWNGATEVSSWRILTGDSASALTQVALVPRRGFETQLAVAVAAVVQAQALAKDGSVLGTSAAVTA